MSKRRISNQQSARIEKKQTSHRKSLTMEDNPDTADGLVITRYARHAKIEDTQGRRIICSIRPNLTSLVAGDRIVWQIEGDGQGVVISCYPRQSVLGRPDKQKVLKPVAANITQLMIVVAPKPEISWSLLDSYLVVAEHLNLHACIVLNKIDLADEALLAQLKQQYEPLGYDLLFTGHDNNNGYQSLENALKNHISVFVGQSGVGKSSLITKMLPLEDDIQTGEISAKTDLGRHTTSNSTFYHLPFGGGLIDSPGVREFGLWHMPSSEIARGYREFKPYLSQCKFRNCTHRDSPGCALLIAVKEKLVSSKRYENYVKISTQFAK